MAKRIDISDMSVYYGAFKAVEDVNLAVEPRSVTALIGPSGCGKSTVLRSLNRMHEVLDGARVEGKVLLDGEDIYGSDIDPVNVRRVIGWSSNARTVPDDVDLRKRRRGPEAGTRPPDQEGRD